MKDQTINGIAELVGAKCIQGPAVEASRQRSQRTAFMQGRPQEE